MTDIVKGMAREAQCVLEGPSTTYDPVLYEAAMRGALLWLAENVSDEMAAASLAAFCNAPDETLVQDVRKHIIAAALRAAAGGVE
jgi:hypothetical protein